MHRQRMNQHYLEKLVHFVHVFGFLRIWLRTLVAQRLLNAGAGPSFWLCVLYRFENGPELWGPFPKKAAQAHTRWSVELHLKSREAMR